MLLAQPLPILLLALLLSGVTFLSNLGAQEPSADRGAVKHWRGENGDYYAFDGVFYSFINTTGQGVKLWTPPTDRPVRGVILHGNPGGGFGGDTRSKTRRRDVMEFAARHDFAVAGVTGFPGRRTYEDLAKHIIEAMRQWGKQGDHPELAHVPFICTGGSNAGMFSFQMMCFAPERTIAITPNVGGVYGPPVTDAVRAVPAWMHIGILDTLLTAGVENTEALYAEHGGPATLWAWDAEVKGHENGSSDHVDVAYWDAVIGMRLPESLKPGEPVPLRKLDPADGWLVDHETWDHRITAIHAARGFDYPKDHAGRYGWMPSEGLARLYQATATRSRPLVITVAEVDSPDDAGTSGTYLSSGQSLMADPGDTIRLKARTTRFLRGVEEVEIHDQDGLIGKFNMKETDTFSFKVDGAKRVYALYAFFRDRRNTPRVSAPVQVIVRDPEVTALIDAQLAGLDLARVAKARAGSCNVVEAVRGEIVPVADLKPDMLGAVRLTAEQSKALATAGKHEALWDAVRATVRPVRVDDSHAGAPGGPAAVEVSAAYDAAGLHMCFRVKDVSFEAEDVGSIEGALDFHLASISRRAMAEATGLPEVYAMPILRSLLRSALQIQVPVGGALDGDHEFSANYWDPWDPARFATRASADYAGTGVRIEKYAAGPGARTLELTLPWALAGNPGFKDAPPAGSRLAVEIGYNGQTPGPQGNLRWPYKQDAWTAKPDAEKPVYGEIVLLEAD